MKLDLSGKTILMSGGLGALANSIIRSLAGAGAKMLITDRISTEEALPRLHELGIDEAAYHPMDVTKPEDVSRTVANLLERHPECDIALGHAGGCGLHWFRETSAEEYEKVFNFNFFGQVHFARAVLAGWVVRSVPGHLIFTSSYVAQIPHGGIPSYAPAKAALENYAHCLALEYAAERIRFNCIAPGNVAAGASLKVYEEDEGYRGFVDRVTPFGERNTPEGIANAFLFLCSPLANEWNGQVLHVDHGITIPKIG